MRHKVAGWKLGRNTSHRRALLRNLTTSVIVEERVETTLTKAKAVRPHVEKMITLAKRGDVSARRQALSYMMTRESVDKLFDTIGPRFGDRLFCRRRVRLRYSARGAVPFRCLQGRRCQPCRGLGSRTTLRRAAARVVRNDQRRGVPDDD